MKHGEPIIIIAEYIDKNHPEKSHIKTPLETERTQEETEKNTHEPRFKLEEFYYLHIGKYKYRLSIILMIAGLTILISTLLFVQSENNNCKPQEMQYGKTI